ncbi:MAG: DNA-binding protein [Bacteroidales bacterium]|nr:DNA-binding protein [Bacteroidales bacterium]
MKLRYLFFAIVSCVLLFAGCKESYEIAQLDEIQLSQTFVCIPVEGGSTKVSLTAKTEWEFDKIFSVNVLDENGNKVKDEDGKYVYENVALPDWLDVSPLSGDAGEFELTFSAEGSEAGRETSLAILANGKKQHITVRQGEILASEATCAEVIAGADGKTYIVEGVCTRIANTTYGNWYLDDGTGEIYIYGTVNATGAYDWAGFGIEVGDVVKVKGPKLTYGSVVELVDATCLSVTKSLLQVVTPELTAEKEGGEVVAKFVAKGSDFGFDMPDDIREWAQILRTGKISAESAGDPDTTTVTIAVAANLGAARTGEITFTSGSSAGTVVISQDGAIIDATAAEINAAEDGATQYRLTGYVSSVANEKYGNLYIKDYSGEVYIYGTNDFADSGIQAGDIITVVGPKSSYNSAPQMVNVTLEERIGVTDISLADFRNLPDDKTAWYRISGKVGKSTEANTKYDLEQYGNFALIDGTTEVYIYGVKTGWGGAKGEFGTLGIKEGDELTIVCYKTSYNGLIEADGCFYISHVSEGGETPDPDQPEGGKYVKVTASQTDWTGKYLIVFGENAHATISGKDLIATAAVTVSGDAIESSAEVDAAAVTVAKNGEKYSIALPDGQYFGMAHNACSSSASAYDVDFEYTADGIKISGEVSGKTAMYYLYYNSATAGSSYYRCYVDKTGTTGYTLPVLYKYAE